MSLEGCSWQKDFSLSLCELLSFEQLVLGQEGTTAIYSFGKRKMKVEQKKSKHLKVNWK